MTKVAEGVELPPVPEAPKAEGERLETAKPLIDSDWGYPRMVMAMKDRKAYDE